MYNLPNITVLELYNLGDAQMAKYMALEKIMKADGNMFGKYKAKPLGGLTFGQVGQLKKSIKNATPETIFDMFNIIYNCKQEAYYAAKVTEYFKALNWVKDELLSLIKKEHKVLTADPNFEWDMAGGKRLAVFGELNTLIPLGRSFSQSPEIIEGWKYNLVFAIMAFDKTSAEIQKRYSELTKKK